MKILITFLLLVFISILTNASVHRLHVKNASRSNRYYGQKTKIIRDSKDLENAASEENENSKIIYDKKFLIKIVHKLRNYINKVT